MRREAEATTDADVYTLNVNPDARVAPQQKATLLASETMAKATCTWMETRGASVTREWGYTGVIVGARNSWSDVRVFHGMIQK